MLKIVASLPFHESPYEFWNGNFAWKGAGKANPKQRNLLFISLMMELCHRNMLPVMFFFRQNP